jgi:hypothetical protein
MTAFRFASVMLERAAREAMKANIATAAPLLTRNTILIASCASLVHASTKRFVLSLDYPVLA